MKYLIDLDIPKGTDYIQIKYYPKKNGVVHENKYFIDENFIDVDEFKKVETIK
jgi:hypothetical protein